MLFVNWNNENHRKEHEVLSHSPRRGRTARRSVIVVQSIQSSRVWYFSLMNIQWLNISPLDIWNAEWFCNRTGNIPLRITLTDFRCLFPDIQIFKDYMDLWYSSAGVKRFIWTTVEVLFRLTHIGKSRKQNPKIGFFTERHFRKQNPTQISADDDVTCLKYFWYR